MACCWHPPVNLRCVGFLQGRTGPQSRFIKQSTCKLVLDLWYPVGFSNGRHRKRFIHNTSTGRRFASLRELVPGAGGSTALNLWCWTCKVRPGAIHMKTKNNLHVNTLNVFNIRNSLLRSFWYQASFKCSYKYHQFIKLDGTVIQMHFRDFTNKNSHFLYQI